MPIHELRVGLCGHNQEWHSAVVRYAGVRESGKGAELLRSQGGAAEAGASSRSGRKLTIWLEIQAPYATTRSRRRGPGLCRTARGNFITSQLHHKSSLWPAPSTGPSHDKRPPREAGQPRLRLCRALPDWSFSAFLLQPALIRNPLARCKGHPNWRGHQEWAGWCATSRGGGRYLVVVSRSESHDAALPSILGRLFRSPSVGR